MIRTSATLALSLALIATACGASDTPDPELGPRAILPDGSQREMTPEERGIAMRAVKMLAEELNAPMTQVSVISIKPVNWPDSSVGCPQPGQAYAQVITPGHRIVLRARGEIHVMHEAGSDPFVCKRSKPVASLSPRRELAWADMAAKAREDLAQQLSVEVDAIKVVDAKRRRFDDADLGCPAPGTVASPAPVDGYVLVLRHDRRNFTYHTDLERVIACPAIVVD